MSKGIISKTGERVEFPAAEAALIGALTDIPEGGDFESKETTHILKLVKEFTAHRSVHPFDRSKIHRPLDNRGKLSISLPDDDENGKKWYRVWITTKITKDPHPGKGVETSPTRELFNLFKGAHALDVADLRDLCAIAIATRYSAYTEEQRNVIFGPLAHPDEQADIKSEYKWVQDEPDLEKLMEEKGLFPTAAPKK